MVEQGNIDLTNRPVIQNADGSHSTEFSYSFGENGREILVPTIVNGKFLTPDGKKPPEGYKDKTGKYHPTKEEQAMFDRAEEYYHRTHQHLGIFTGRTPEEAARNADAAADQIHNRPM